MSNCPDPGQTPLKAGGAGGPAVCVIAQAGGHFDSCDECPEYEAGCRVPRAIRERERQQRMAEERAKPFCPFDHEGRRCPGHAGPGGCALFVARPDASPAYRGCALALLGVWVAGGAQVTSYVLQP